MARALGANSILMINDYEQGGDWLSMRPAAGIVSLKELPDAIRLVAENAKARPQLIRCERLAMKIQAVASLAMPEANRPLAMSIFVALYFSGAAFVSAAANAPRVRSVFSVLPFR